MRVGAIEVFRTQRNNNLDARSALRRSPLDRSENSEVASVTTCHTSSQSVTLCHKCDTLPYAVKRFRSLACYMGQAENGRMVRQVPGRLLRQTFQRMLEEQKQISRTPFHPSTLLMTPEQCAEFLGIKINTIYVMKSQGRIPYRKVGHLLRFDFDEIVEWTKDKEK